MTANFWTSSHYKQLLEAEKVNAVHPLDRARGFTLDDFKLIKMNMANYIAKLAIPFKLRQRVVATAVTYMRRVYTKKSMTECEPRVLAPACLYLASKAEETTIQARHLVSYNKRNYPDDKYRYEIKEVLEMEMKILEALDYYLVVFHPYRSLAHDISKVWGELDGDIPYPCPERQGGCGRRPPLENLEKRRLLQDAGMGERESVQFAWGLVNDTYKMDLILVHPPHLITLACVYITSVFREKDTITWFEELHVDMNVVKNISMEILDFYDNVKTNLEERTNSAFSKLFLRH